MSHVTTYTYGAGSTGNPQLANDLLTITAPNAQPGGPDAGKATVNVYDSSGRVTSQTDPMGYQTTFNYCVNAALGDCLNTATGTGMVAITDPDGNTTVEYYDQGLQASSSTFAGSVSQGNLLSETDVEHDMAGGTFLPLSSTDGNGRSTSDTLNDLGEATARVLPDGTSSGTAITTSGYATQDYATEKLPNCTTSATATSVCTASQATGAAPVAAGPAPVSAAQTITPPSQVPPAGVSWTQYDANGDDLYVETGASQPGGGTQAQVAYQLYNSNSITLPETSSAVTCADTAPSAQLPCATINADGMITQLEYDSAGDLISSSKPADNGSGTVTTTYSYDADGEQVSTTSPGGNLPGANAGNYTQTTTYNADGRPLSVTVGGGTGHTVTPRTNSSGYDADGNVVTSTDALGNATTTAYDADDKPILTTDPTGDATLTCYDGDGDPAQSVPPAGVGRGRADRCLLSHQLPRRIQRPAGG